MTIKRIALVAIILLALGWIVNLYLLAIKALETLHEAQKAAYQMVGCE